MADFGSSLGVPNATPAGAIGQKQYPNRQRGEERPREKEKKKERLDKPHLATLPQDGDKKTAEPTGKGGLVDIVV